MGHVLKFRKAWNGGGMFPESLLCPSTSLEPSWEVSIQALQGGWNRRLEGLFRREALALQLEKKVKGLFFYIKGVFIFDELKITWK